MSHERPQPEPLAIVAGVRTPFAKAFGALANCPADELGRLAVEAVLARSGVSANDVDEVVIGNVAGPADASNVGRVIALRAGVPHDRIAHTVNRNCASGMESIITAWQAIREQRSKIIVAGGTESMSSVPLLWDERAKQVMLQLSRARSVGAKVKALTGLRPGFFKPIPALEVGLTDPTCGLSMGQTAEILAREFLISREQQDEFALRSHQRTTAAWTRSFFDDEVIGVPATSAGGDAVQKDVGPREGQSIEALAKLKPIFEKHGTVTAGNSCSITDGAAAVVLMSATDAEQAGHTPLGYIRDYAIAGCDPRRMGLGPVFAIDRLLKQSGLALNDFDLVEINEAFAAQVLACCSALKSEQFAKEFLSRESAVGELDPEKVNVNGGAIAVGHPVGTSGTRLIITLLRALHEKGLKRGLATLCVGGGQGVAVCVETGR